jgi:chromatin assembly factor 1 subunit B
MSSSDGFCSTLSFSPGELGSIYAGQVPTYQHPVVSTSVALPTSSATSTPIPTPTATASPSLVKASPIIPPPSHPSPAPTFSMRPGSPTRSNSQSSIATMTSIQTAGQQAITNNPTPTMGHVPLATAMNTVPPVAIPPMSTPPQTPASTHGGLHSATSSVSGSVLGKRDTAATASESEREDGTKAKKRRVAPTLVGPSASSSSTEQKKD